MAMLGLAFGAGLLLSAIIGGPRRSTRRKPSSTSGSPGNYETEAGQSDFQGGADSNRRASSASRTLDNLKGALVGVAITKCAEFLEELLPGFTDQYHKTEARNSTNEPDSSSARVN